MRHSNGEIWRILMANVTGVHLVTVKEHPTLSAGAVVDHRVGVNPKTEVSLGS
jgi:hypothetical protein